MGVFYTACTLLSIIGKRFQDAGLRDLCVESGAIVEGSVAGVLDGRRYNRGVRLHKIMHEALMRLELKGLDRGELEGIQDYYWQLLQWDWQVVWWYLQNTVQEAHDQCRFRQTFWQIRGIPPVWEWQAIQVLVSLPRYGRDSPKTSESIVGRQLGTICFSNKEHDSMVLCISELGKTFILLSIRNVSPWRGESRCFSVFEIRWLLSTDWIHEDVRQNSRKSNLSRDWIETLKHMVAQRGSAWSQDWEQVLPHSRVSKHI